MKRQNLKDDIFNFCIELIKRQVAMIDIAENIKNHKFQPTDGFVISDKPGESILKPDAFNIKNEIINGVVTIKIDTDTFLILKQTQGDNYVD